MKEEYLSLKEVQLEELKILHNVVKYLDKHKLTYCLCGGTLLGAVRHKGFIPWDDDIDISMKREDYEKFLEYSKTEKIDDSYEVLCIEKNNSTRTFCKVVNKNLPITSKSKEDKYLWIDIFPLDKLPESLEEAKKVIDKNLFLKGQIYLRTTKIKDIMKEKKSLKNRIIKIILKPITYRHSVKYYAKKIIKNARKYENNNSSKLADAVWPDGYQSIFNPEWFEKTEKIEFEHEIFNAPCGWKEYLSNGYGNYMELPPEDKRISHNILIKK